MAVLFTVCVGLISLVRVCHPFNLIRLALVIVCTGAFAVCVLFMPTLFKLVQLDMGQLAILALMVAAAIPVMALLSALLRKLTIFARNHV